MPGFILRSIVKLITTLAPNDTDQPQAKASRRIRDDRSKRKLAAYTVFISTSSFRYSAASESVIHEPENPCLPVRPQRFVLKARVY